MARASQFSKEQLVSAAIGLAGKGGPLAVTMQGLAAAAGAASGSVYHRFEGRPDLLGSVWLEAASQFQEDWWQRVEDEGDPGEVAMSTVRWARDRRDLAKILLVHRMADFLLKEAPATLRRRANRLEATGRERFGRLAQRFLFDRGPAALERVTFAFASIPLAALRRPLESDSPIPARLEHLVGDAARGVVKKGAS